MSAEANKQLMEQIFNELSKGNSRPFLESMADEFVWMVSGTSKWSRRFVGKRAVVEEVFGGLRANLNLPIITVASRILGDGDYVVVEATGRNTTKSGAPYNNRYCFVFRLAHGKLLEVTEYMDTALVDAAFEDPPVTQEVA